MLEGRFGISGLANSFNQKYSIIFQVIYFVLIV